MRNIKVGNDLYYSSTTFSFSSAWKSICPNTCASHSFLTSAYFSLSKTDLLFFLCERTFSHYHYFLFLYPHLFFLMAVIPTWLRHISCLWHVPHLDISSIKTSVCRFDSWLFCCRSSGSGLSPTNEWISPFSLCPEAMFAKVFLVLNLRHYLFQ